MLSSTVSVGDIATATQYNNLVSDVASYAGDYGTSAGSANTQTLSVNAVITSYADKQIFKFKAGYTNTASMTLNVNYLGAKTLKGRDGYSLKGGEVRAGNIYYVAYDGTNLQLLNGNDPVVDVSSTTQTCENNVTYISSATGELTYTLPTTSAVGDKITILGRARWKVVHGTGQGITLHNSLSTNTTGWLKGDGARDSVVLRCYVANSYWVVESYSGNPQIDTETGWGEPAVLGYVEDSDTYYSGVTDDWRVVPYVDGSNNILLCRGGVVGIAKGIVTLNNGNIQTKLCTALTASTNVVGRPVVHGGYMTVALRGASATTVRVVQVTADIATTGNWGTFTVSGRTMSANEGFIGFSGNYLWTADTAGYYYYTVNYGSATLTYAGSVTVTSSTYSATYSAVNEAGILASFASNVNKFCNHAGTIDVTKWFSGIGASSDCLAASRYSFYACIETERATTTDTFILAKIL